MSDSTFNWRDHLAVHPAADLFPLMSETELKELAKDIKANELQTRIVLWSPYGVRGETSLLDGRNRLDALALLGWLEVCKGGLRIKPSTDHQLEEEIAPFNGDPYAIALSLNAHRRHLTPEQKREQIDKVLAANPDKSDRRIASITKSDHKTVGKRRAAKEGCGEIPHVETRTDTKGRKQPSRKSTDKTITVPVVSSAPEPKQISVRVESAANDSGSDFEKLKTQVAELEQQQIDLIIQERKLVEQANLTPAQAREIQELLEKLGDKFQAALDESAFGFVDRIVQEDDERKRLTKEAKNSQKALDGERQKQQRDEMECDRDEAKQEAREGGESWSEIKDQWEDDWIRDNWNDEREQQFLREFKDKWKREHRQEFPNSDFAPTSKAAKAAA